MSEDTQTEAAPETETPPASTDTGVLEPVVMKARTMLRDTFMRAWRIGQQMGAEGIVIALLCPECKQMVQLGTQEARIVELRCGCTVWTIRSIHV